MSDIKKLEKLLDQAYGDLLAMQCISVPCPTCLVDAWVSCPETLFGWCTDRFVVRRQWPLCSNPTAQE